MARLAGPLPAVGILPRERQSGSFLRKKGGALVQEILSFTRRAVEQYAMIEAGDRVGVGVSGGKDSVLLLLALAKLAQFFPRPFTVVGLTLDPRFGGTPTDYGAIETFCAAHGIEYFVRRTDIGPVVFEARQEKNPCSLCAKMRRGALHDFAKEHGCNKLALGHHADDAAETFFLNLLFEGRVGCFSPVTYLSRKDITVVRPFCLLPESKIVSAARRLEIPTVKSACPVDGGTARQEMKVLLDDINRQYHGVRQRILGALQRGHIDRW